MAVVVVAVRGGRGVTVEARRVCLSRFEKAGSGSVAARAGRGKRAWGQTDPVMLKHFEECVWVNADTAHSRKPMPDSVRMLVRERARNTWK